MFHGVSPDRKMFENLKNSQIKPKKVKIFGLILILLIVITGVSYIYLTRSTHLKEKKPIVAVVSINGTIENFDPAHRISSLSKNSLIEAVVIKIDSGGGYVSPSFQLESAISDLSEDKHTAAVIGEAGASGAYLAASAADKIYVHHNSVVGSVSVIAVWTSLENKYESEGIEHYVFQSGEHKDMFAPWRGPTENEKEIINEKIRSIQQRMIEVITNNRPSLENDIPHEVLSGETVYGFGAVDMGLADKIIMTPEEAITQTALDIGLEEGEYKVLEL